MCAWGLLSPLGVSTGLLNQAKVKLQSPALNIFFSC
jgi:hypothetical protein